MDTYILVFHTKSGRERDDLKSGNDAAAAAAFFPLCSFCFFFSSRLLTLPLYLFSFVPFSPLLYFVRKILHTMTATTSSSSNGRKAQMSTHTHTHIMCVRFSSASFTRQPMGWCTLYFILPVMCSVCKLKSCSSRDIEKEPCSRNSQVATMSTSSLKYTHEATYSKAERKKKNLFFLYKNERRKIRMERRNI